MYYTLRVGSHFAAQVGTLVEKVSCSIIRSHQNMSNSDKRTFWTKVFWSNWICFGEIVWWNTTPFLLVGGGRPNSSHSSARGENRSSLKCIV